MAIVRRMRKTDLMTHFIEHFSSRGVALRRSDAREFLEELHRLCVQQLKDTGEFTLPRIAKFVLRHRAARAARNPRTGALPGALAPRGFRPGPPGRRPAGQRRS